MRGSYWNFYGYTERDPDHYKQVSFAIDLILSTIEKYYYFSDMIDYFPKVRLIPLIGLSLGFVIESSDINSGFTSKHLYDNRYHDYVINKICSKVYSKIEGYESNK